MHQATPISYPLSERMHSDPHNKTRPLLISFPFLRPSTWGRSTPLLRRPPRPPLRTTPTTPPRPLLLSLTAATASLHADTGLSPTSPPPPLPLLSPPRPRRPLLPGAGPYAPTRGRPRCRPPLSLPVVVQALPAGPHPSACRSGYGQGAVAIDHSVRALAVCGRSCLLSCPMFLLPSLVVVETSLIPR